MHGRYDHSTGLHHGDIEIMKSNRIFIDVPYETMLSTISRCTVKTLTNGQTLFHQREPFSAIYFVLAGHLKVFRNTRDGTPVVLGIFGVGHSVAEAVLFMENQYPASCTAVGETRVLRMAASVAEEIVTADLTIAQGVQQSSAQHLRDMAEHVESVKGLSGIQRVAAYLLKLAGTDRGQCTLRLPYEKVLIAGLIGMKPESLSRAFKKMDQLGVHVHENTVTIDELSRLHTLLLGEAA